MAAISRSIESLQKSISDCRDGYYLYVKNNPDSISQIEKSIKTLCYVLEFLPKNYEDSIYLTETLTSMNNLFSYFNDCIIRGKKKFSSLQSYGIVEQIKQWMVLIEFTQAFFEISAKRVGGSGARWAVIAVISLIKAILRLILLYGYNSGIQTHPFIKPLNKEKLVSSVDTDNETCSSTAPFVYEGPRTGLKMRTLANTPPMNQRTWTVPDINDNLTSDLSSSPTNLSQLQKTGEALHILRPLIHLTSMAFFGTKSIIPWLVALTTDASSHTLLTGKIEQRLNKRSELNLSERKELQRRAFVMFLYVLRSPLYDRYTKTKVLGLLQVLSENIPLVRFILQPLAKYLPVWQQYYFYNWME